MPEPLTIRLSLIRLGTLLVLVLFGSWLLLLFLLRNTDITASTLLIWPGILGVLCIIVAWASLSLRLDTAGLWINSPFNGRHIPWNTIEAIRVTGRIPMLGIGFVLDPPSPERKKGIDADIGPFWAMPNDELYELLSACTEAAKASQAKSKPKR